MSTDKITLRKKINWKGHDEYVIGLVEAILSLTREEGLKTLLLLEVSEPGMQINGISIDLQKLDGDSEFYKTVLLELGAQYRKKHGFSLNLEPKLQIRLNKLGEATTLQMAHYIWACINECWYNRDSIMPGKEYSAMDTTAFLFKLVKDLEKTNPDDIESKFFGALQCIQSYCNIFSSEEKRAISSYLKPHWRLVDELFSAIKNERMEQDNSTSVTPKAPVTPTTSETPKVTAKPKETVQAAHPITEPAPKPAEISLIFAIENSIVLEELLNHQWLISMLSKESITIPEVIKFLSKAGLAPAPSKELLELLVENYEILKGHTPATIKEALAKVNDPAALKAALLAALEKK